MQQKKEMHAVHKKMMIRLSAVVLFLAMALFLRIGARRIPGFADAYTRISNPFWRGVIGRIVGWLPFSLAELLIYVAILVLVIWLVRLLILLLRKVQKKKTGADVGHYLLGSLLKLCLIAAIYFFLFEANEDVYFRAEGFAKVNGFGQGSYTTEELYRVSALQVERINALADAVSRDAAGVMQLTGTDDGREDIRDRVREAMRDVSETYHPVGYAGEAGKPDKVTRQSEESDIANRQSGKPAFFPRPKGILVSLALSYTHFSGISSVYTVEANYNRDMTAYNIPFTMCHELAHLWGVLPENEANFVAYLAARDAEDADIAYSGAVLGWIYCGNELYKRDRDLWAELWQKIDARAKTDMDANSVFWKQYEGKASEKAQQLNDAYLKAEGLPEGRLSYDMVVDLIVDYEIEKE